MILTLYGKRGNVWTDKVCVALSEVYDFTLKEEFEWARDKYGRDQACRVDERGMAWVTRMPTLHINRWTRPFGLGVCAVPNLAHFITQPSDEWWVIGVDDCLSFIEWYWWTEWKVSR